MYLQTNILEISRSINILLVLFSSFLIFFMQPGFALLEVGQVRAKNTANVAMKNLIDWSQGVLMYFFLGSSVAYLAGSLTAPGTVLLTDAFMHFSDSSVLSEWLFGAVFAMTAATIVSGAVVGRIKFSTYVVFGAVIVTVIYPVVQGLTWQGLLTADGYLGQLFGTGYIDFAGGTVVHMTGGIAGLVAAWAIGPRNNRYQDGRMNVIPGHSVFFSLLGAFVLAFGWYGFNVGSHATVLTASGTFEGAALAEVAVNTTLAMGAGTLAAAIVTAWIREKPDPLFSANGMIAGLVAITAGAAHVTWWGSILIGAIGGATVMPIHKKIIREYQIDDAISVFPVHGVAGAVGALLLPLFAVGPNGGWQILGLNQFLMQAAGITTIAVWTAGSSIAGLWAIKHLLDLDLRVSDREEEMGLDASEHNIMAYPEFAQTGGLTAGTGTDDGDATGRDSAGTTLTDGSSRSDATGGRIDSKTTAWRGQEVEPSSMTVDESDTATTTWRGQTVEISNRTEYERELRELTDRLELALEETNTGVWEWNLDTDDLHWDEASEKLFDYEVGTFPGTFGGFASRVDPDDLGTVKQEIEKALETGEEYRADFRVLPPGGDQRWVQARGVVEYDDSGNPERMVGIQTDITRQKERELELEEAKRKLEQTNEKLEQFASVLSHDLRNPLNVAQLRVENLDESEDDDHIEAVKKNLDRMEKMIEDVLTLARAGVTVEHRERISLANVAAESWDTARTEEAGFELEIPESTTIMADRDRLRHVFENLFRNAVEHNDHPLTIRVGMCTAAETAGGDTTVGFFVEDDGDGIPADERNDVFDRGYTTSSKGTGFGLSIVTDVVEAHGWQINTVESASGGARFEITGVELTSSPP
jgi:Amt family ammonium transporter